MDHVSHSTTDGRSVVKGYVFVSKAGAESICCLSIATSLELVKGAKARAHESNGEVWPERRVRAWLSIPQELQEPHKYMRTF